MTPVVFIAADPRECVEWIKHWDDVKAVPLPVHWARAGMWKGRRVMAVVNGAGPDRAYAAAMAAANVLADVGAFCSIGFCGALDEALRVGDVVQVSEVRSDDALVRTAGPKDGYLVASVNHIVATAKEKRTLRNAGASVVEMESAGVARAAAELNIPFYCIRAVSDTAQEDFVNDFEAALLPDGRFSVAKLVVGALGNPVARFSELIRLGQRTALASRNLGEFLANCSF